MTNYSYGYGYPMFNASATLTPVAQALLSIWNSDGSADYPVNVLDYPENTTTQYRINEEGKLELAPAYIAPVWDGKRLVVNLISQVTGTHLTDTDGNGVPDNWYNFNSAVGCESKPSTLDANHTAIRHFGTSVRPQTGPSDGTSYVVKSGEYYWVGFYIEELVTQVTLSSRQLAVVGSATSIDVAGSSVGFSTAGWKAVKVQITSDGWAGPRYGLGIDGNSSGDFTWSHPFLQRTTADSTAPPEYVPVGVGIGEELVVNGDYSQSGVGNAQSASGGILNNVSEELRITSDGSSGYSRGVWPLGTTVGDTVEIVADIISVVGSTRFINVSDNVGVAISSSGTFRTTIVMGGSTQEIGFGGLGDTGFELLLDNVSIKSTAQPSTQLDGAKYFDTANTNSVDIDGVVTQGAEVLLDPDTFGVYLAGGGGNLQTNPTDLSSWTATDDLAVSTDPAVKSIFNLDTYKLTSNTAVGNHRVFDHSTALVSGNTYVSFVALKYIDHKWVALRANVAGKYQSFDLENQAVGTTGVGIDDAGVIPYDDGWAIYWVKYTASSSASAALVVIFNEGDVATEQTYEGSSTACYACAAQTENSPVPTRFTEHSSVAATNDVSAVLADFGFDDTQGAIEFDITFDHDWADLPTATESLVDVRNSANTSMLYRHVGNTLSTYDNTTLIYGNPDAKGQAGVKHKIKLFWGDGLFNASFDGVLINPLLTNQPFDGWDATTLFAILKGYAYGATVKNLKIHGDDQGGETWLEA